MLTVKKRDTLKSFFDVLDAHQPRIDRTKKKVDDIYAFRTPEAPYFEFSITDQSTSLATPFEYKPGTWVESEYDEKLDAAIQRIEYNLNAFPHNDYVPSIFAGHGTSDLIPRLYGCEFDKTPEGGVINTSYRITDLGAEIDGFLAEKVDLAADPRIADGLEYARYVLDAVDGRVQITYPQMQGPTTNAVRIMEQTEMLMACITDKPNMIRLVERITEHMIGIIKLVLDAVGDPNLVRPRGRFYQPENIMGLMVDDYISVVGPAEYEEICTGSWKLMAEELGRTYLHTCGPVMQSAEMMLRLPGLAVFETAFIDRQITTSINIVDMKKKLDGGIVLGTFGTPFGEPFQDEENFTREWLVNVSRGGGYLMHASGTYDYGLELFNRLGIGH